jgi:hypothetical protein
MGRISPFVGAMISVALVLAGCNGDKKPEPLPEAGPLLEEVAGKIQNAQTFKLEISVSGYPVTIGTTDFELPADLPLWFRYAKGVFVAPDRLHADVEVSLGDLATTAELIAIDRDQYLRSDLLTQDRWLEVEIIRDFSPASLMAPNGGIAYALHSITDAKMVGEKDVDGVNMYLLTGLIKASDVNAVTFGLIGTTEGTIAVDVYILKEGHLVDKLVLHEPLPAGVEDQEPTTWTIGIMDYNESAAVEAPEVGSTGEG